MADDKLSLTLTVPGMGSDHCAGIIRGTLEKLGGIDSLHTNIASHKVSLEYDPNRLDRERIRKAVEGAGYNVAAVSGGHRQIRLTVPGMAAITAPASFATR